MTVVRPFFSYFGSKWRSARHYPKPQHDLIIEPFAGGAGYSLNYANKNVLLVDSDERTIMVWNWLIKSSPQDILKLPTKIWHVDELPDSLSEEAKLLIGSWLKKSTVPWSNKIRSSWSMQCASSHWSDSIKFRIASSLKEIRHWKTVNSSYTQIENQKATWFIDPPYQREALKKCYRDCDIDFSQLAEFSKSRFGQVIVCEQDGADWLPFQPFKKVHSTNNRNKSNFSDEVIWCK